jgi:hypothetical protein
MNDFQFLTYAWSASLSILNWTAVLGTIYLLEKYTRKEFAYLFSMVFVVYSITLTSYLDSTINFAILAGVSLYVLSRDENYRFWKLALFALISVASTSVHEIMLPIFATLFSGLCLRVYLARKELNYRTFSNALFRLVIILISFLILAAHFLRNREAYTTVDSALIPNFIDFSTYDTHPRSYLIVFALLIIGWSFSNLTYKSLNQNVVRLAILSISFILPLVVLLDSYKQKFAPRYPFLEYEYRSDYSIAIIGSYLVLMLGSQYLRKFNKEPSSGSFEKITKVSLLAILIASSLSHINVTLNWQNCWDKNIEVHRNSLITPNEKFIGSCNTAGWTTLMTSIVYSNNNVPSHFIINSKDFVLSNTDPSFVQKYEETLVLPFGLRFPLISPGLNLSNLPSSN